MANSHHFHNVKSIEIHSNQYDSTAIGKDQMYILTIEITNDSTDQITDTITLYNHNGNLIDTVNGKPISRLKNKEI